MTDYRGKTALSLEPALVVPTDTGCRLHPACLTCPRSACIYDHEDRHAAREAQRAAFLADYHRLPRRGGVHLGLRALAAQHGVSQRTAARWARGE